MAKHLHHAGKIEMTEAAAESSVIRVQHLRGLEAVSVTLQERAHVRGDVFSAQTPVDVVVTPGAKRFHQGLVAAITHGDDGNVRGLGVGMKDLWQLVCAHLAQSGGAEDGDGRVPLERSECECRLSVVYDVEPDRDQR